MKRSIDQDLLGYVSGDKICAMCQRNGQTRCDHKNVKTPLKLITKGTRLMDYLLEDYQRTTSNSNATYIDMLPSEVVDCLSGYDENLEKVMERICLKDMVSNNGTTLTRSHVYNYARHIVHTEETDNVQTKTRVKYDPNAFEKVLSIDNIEYRTGLNAARDDAFVKYHQRLMASRLPRTAG